AFAAVIGAAMVSSHPGLAQTVPGIWTTVAPMPTVRSDLAAATGSDGRIYAIGGDTLSAGSGAFLDIVEAYDPRTNTWSCSRGDTSPGCANTSLAPMPTPRGFL